MRILGLIPARAGSKGIPNKNIRPLAGKPLVEHTMDSAIEAHERGVLTKIIVSTDCPTVAGVARSKGLEVPFVRPAELATDEARIGEVAIHALDFLRDEMGEEFDALMLLQATCPLRNSNDIEAAVKLFTNEEADNVVSMCEVETHHPFYMYTIDTDGSPSMFSEDAAEFARRQEFPKVYERNGAIYLIKTELLRKHRSFYFGENIKALIMPEKRSVNIDRLMDLRLAEVILKECRD
jgi:N-acylneuraminate cytidylyltransferase/CMP-N,N'-diacetyllegionaminic acid synthase